MPYYLAPWEKMPARDGVQCQPIGCEGVVRGPIDLRLDGGTTWRHRVSAAVYGGARDRFGGRPRFA